MWRRIFWENLDLKLLSLLIAVGLVYVQWQRQLGVELMSNIPVVVDKLPSYLEVHPDQPTINATCELSGPQQVLKFATENQFRFKIDYSQLNWSPTEKRKVVPLSSDLLTSTLLPTYAGQLKMAEGTQVPSQIELIVISDRGPEPPPYPDTEEGVYTIVLLRHEKEVDIVVPIVGDPPNGKHVTVEKTPDKVLIRGSADTLNLIKQVTAETAINITGQTQDFETLATIEDFDPEMQASIIEPATRKVLVKVQFRNR